MGTLHLGHLSDRDAKRQKRYRVVVKMTHAVNLIHSDSLTLNYDIFILCSCSPFFVNTNSLSTIAVDICLLINVMLDRSILHTMHSSCSVYYIFPSFMTFKLVKLQTFSSRTAFSPLTWVRLLMSVFPCWHSV